MFLYQQRQAPPPTSQVLSEVLFGSLLIQNPLYLSDSSLLIILDRHFRLVVRIYRWVIQRYPPTHVYQFVGLMSHLMKTTIEA